MVRQIQQEARFVTLHMYASEIRMVLLTAYDEGMLNGDYIFLSNEMYTYISKSQDYRSDITNDVLFEGFLMVSPQEVSGEAWEQLEEEIIQAFADPHFDGYNDELITATNYYAGGWCIILFYLATGDFNCQQLENNFLQCRHNPMFETDCSLYGYACKMLKDFLMISGC